MKLRKELKDGLSRFWRADWQSRDTDHYCLNCEVWYSTCPKWTCLVYRSAKKQDVLTTVACERSPVCHSGSGYTQQYHSAGRRLPLIISTGSVHGERQEILLLLAACQSCWLTQICDVCVLAFGCCSVVCFTVCVFTVQRVCVAGRALCSCVCVSVWCVTAARRGVPLSLIVTFRERETSEQLLGQNVRAHAQMMSERTDREQF